MKKPIRVALVITAAGSSSRFNTGEKKEFLPLVSPLFPNKKTGTVLSCSIEPFLQFFNDSNSSIISNLIITIPTLDETKKASEALYVSTFVRDMLTHNTIEPTFVQGSTTRQSSVFCALKHLHNLNTDIDLVLIHDAARPFVSVEIVQNVVEMALKKGAAVPSVTPVDTQKEIDSTGKIVRHLTRSNLGAVQTPQGFRFKEIYNAHEKAFCDEKEYTDDTEIWHRYVGDVYAVQGSELNKKITYQQDLTNSMKDELIYRTGLGYDLHKLEEGRKLMIGGIEIPFDKGEVAHSDGDVLLHAITDSVLGAAGIADIGELFPPNDMKWKNANSALLLQAAWEKVKDAGWQIQNIDCILQMENPKFLPWRTQVIESISSILKCDISRIFVKAKTAEGLGEIGQGLAVSAQVICLLKKAH